MMNRPGLDRRRIVGLGAAALVAGQFTPRRASARVPERSSAPLAFRNIRLFDGKDEGLREGLQVLVRGDRILSVDPLGQPPPEGARVVDAGGRVLMPGLIDAHYHTMFAALPPQFAQSATLDFIALMATEDMEAALLRGYTSVRDVGGNCFALKRVIDEGRLPGPRIYPSGFALSQTSGHGDFREPDQVPGFGHSPAPDDNFLEVIVDGADAVRRKVREQLFMGASQIKLLAGGGIISLRDPIDSLQYSPEELRAAVEAAADWGTYVTVHAYTPGTIKRAVQAGVRCIEHGQLADEDTVKLMRDHGIWWSLQPFLPGKTSLTDPRQIQKLASVVSGTDNAYRMAQKYGVKVAYGTDYTLNPVGAAAQNVRLAALAKWYSPAAALKMATNANAQLLALSGPRNPYPDGRLGVIEPGAYADLLIVDGAPLTSLDVFLKPEQNLRLVMKDGRIFKNSL